MWACGEADKILVHMSGMIKGAEGAQVKESDNLLGDKGPHCTVLVSQGDVESW